MKRLVNIGLLMLVVFAFSACSTNYHYYTAGDDAISLKQYKSFAWVPKLENKRSAREMRDQKDLGARLNEVNNNRYYNNPAAAQRIKETTIATLKSKGLVLQDTNPDLLVRYSTLVDRGSRNTYYYPGYTGFYGYGWGGYGWRISPYFGGWGGYGGYGATPVNQYFKEGVLAIELIDNHTNQTIWIGYGAGELSRDPKKSIAQLPQLVTDIFKRLPVNM